MKNQFYGVHGRAIQNHNHDQPKGILTKIFKGQHQRNNTFHQQNYIDHLNHNPAFQVRGPMNLKSPNLREHLNT